MAEGETNQEQGFCQRCCNLGYFRTPFGIFKCLELLVVVLGLIFMASVSAINADAIKFFIFAMTTTMIFICIHILLNVMNLYHRLPLIIIANLTQGILCALGALVILIASAIPMKKYSDWKVHAGSVLGLIAMGLFIVEAIYNFFQHKRGSGRAEDKLKATEASPADAEQPPAY